MKQVKEFFKNPPQISIIIFLFFAYAFLGSIFFSCIYQHIWHKSIYKLDYEFGDLLENMVKKGLYQSRNTLHDTLFHTEASMAFSAHRLPLVPYFLYSLIYLTGIETMGKMMLLKNLFFVSLTALSFYYATVGKPLHAKYKWFSLLLLFSFPQIAFWGLGLDAEESYGIPTFALLWGLVCYSEKPNTTFKIWFVFITVTLFFVKNTSLYICPLIPILYYILYKDKQVVAISYVLLLISVLGLSTMNYRNTGKFTPKYSFEGWNFYKGNCPRTMEYYPYYTLDLLDFIDPVPLPKTAVSKEWDYDTYYKKLAFEYISSHKTETFRRLFVKAFTIFVDIRPNGNWISEKSFDSPLKYIKAFYMLIFRILEWFSIASAIYCICKRRQNTRLTTFSVAFLLFVAAFCGPYVLAYGYERHIMPIVIPVIYSTLYFLNEFLYPSKKIAPKK